ncbi:putative endothiapepsin precursor [Diaporthe ampelina]|uniref:Putative endothiapepsin n=1 Tax=Diaporthe ampelina TaxID=1214573 RepID=A0A0G2FTZ0_9PEZI|nr:putative endothiapepsin precursor [Diaporthe ampelina]
MKYMNLAAFAAGLASAAPANQPSAFEGLVSKTAEEVSDFQVQVLGGMTLRAPQVYNTNFIQMKRGPRAYVQSLRKYSAFGATIPPNLLQIIDEILGELGLGDLLGDGTGEVAAVPQMFDSEYLAAVQIGTPPQDVTLNFDTGSSDLWVFSSDTPPAQVSGQKIYTPGQSSTSASVDGASWQITYGDGSGASGIVYTDVVTVGGVSVPNQAVEAATMVSGSFSQDAASSVNTVQPQAQKTFFSNAMANLAMPLFTANLKQGEPGNYNFGFVDQTEFTGNINFVPVNASQGFWAFNSEGFSVGDGQAQDFPHQAIADTGTTLMLVQDQMVEAYYAQVPSAQNNAQIGGFVFDCSEELPSLTANIGGYQAVIPGSIIKFAPADTDSFDTATSCFGGIQSNTGLDFAIYGDIFLKAAFTVFDGGNMRIGFAAKSGQ